MMELFSNPNVASVLVQRLPCAFAPTVQGKMGTHYAMVLLDKDNNVLYVGSECEAKHGDGVQALHELGDQDSTLCYVATSAFKKALSALHAHKGQHLDSVSMFPKDANLLNGYMRSMFNSVWDMSCDKHNKRFAAFMLGHMPHRLRRRDAMQKTVNHVTSSLLCLAPKLIDVGRMRGPATRTVVSEPVYHTIFEVICNDVDEKKFIYKMGFVDGDVFAVREDGQWTVHEDVVKHWAESHHTIRDFRVKHGGYSRPAEKCLFCNETFTRMSKHTQGGKHIDRVLEVAKLTCKATSRMGLQMINNPKTRSVFIKR